MKNSNYQSGLAKLIVMLVVIVLILSYLGINIQKIAESETGQANFNYIWGVIKSLWNYLIEFWENNLKESFTNLWSKLPLTEDLKNL